MTTVTAATEEADVLTLKEGDVFTTGDGIDWKVVSNDGATVHATLSRPAGSHGPTRKMDFTSETVFVISRS